MAAVIRALWCAGVASGVLMREYGGGVSKSARGVLNCYRLLTGERASRVLFVHGCGVPCRKGSREFEICAHLYAFPNCSFTPSLSLSLDGWMDGWMGEGRFDARSLDPPFRHSDENGTRVPSVEWETVGGVVTYDSFMRLTGAGAAAESAREREAGAAWTRALLDVEGVSLELAMRITGDGPAKVRPDLVSSPPPRLLRARRPTTTTTTTLETVYSERISRPARCPEDGSSRKSAETFQSHSDS